MISPDDYHDLSANADPVVKATQEALPLRDWLKLYHVYLLAGVELSQHLQNN